MDGEGTDGPAVAGDHDTNQLLTFGADDPTSRNDGLERVIEWVRAELHAIGPESTRTPSLHLTDVISSDLGAIASRGSERFVLTKINDGSSAARKAA